MPPPTGRPSSVGRLLKAGKKPSRSKARTGTRVPAPGPDRAEAESEASDEEEEIHQFLMGDVFNLIDKGNRKFWDAKLKGRSRGKGVKGPKPKTAAEMTPQAEKMLQDATELYLSNKIDQAVAALKELVKQAPGLHDPFHILGVIYEQEYKDLPSACAYYLLAAHLAPDDVELWKQISEMSMSLGNIDQAVYCLKKCLKNSRGKFDEEALYELSMIYLNSGKYKEASTHLTRLFSLRPEDYAVTDSFARCRRLMGDDRMMCDILEAHVSSYASAAPLAEENAESLKHVPHKAAISPCVDALDALATARLSVGDFRPVSGAPMRGAPAVKSFICRSYTTPFVAFGREIDEALDEVPIAERYALTLAFGSVYAYRGNSECAGVYYLKALKLAREKLPSGGPPLMYSRDALEISRTLVSLDNVDGAIEALRIGIRAPDDLLETLKSGDNWKAALRLNYLFDTQEQPKSFAVTTRLELFNLLSDLGRFSEADMLLSSLTSDDLGRTTAPAPPITTADRQSLLTCLADLSHSISRALLKDPRFRSPPCLACRGAQPCVGASAYTDSDATALLDNLLSLLSDCEQDTLRIRSHMRVQPQPARPVAEACSVGLGVDGVQKSLLLPLKGASGIGESPRTQKGSSYMRVKKHLDLISPEDILGWDGYYKLLENAAIVLCSLRVGLSHSSGGKSGYLGQFIELLETISRNRKQYKFVIQDSEKRLFKTRIDKLSRAISAFFGIHKMALGYIKSEFASPTGDLHPLRTLGRILASGRVSASAAISLSSCPERDTLLEIKTWAVRHLINSPNDLDLAMLVAHFCSLSGRWQFAIAEYTHALSISQDNPLAHLCLAAAHLGSVASKTTRSVDESILQCFAHLDRYKQLRAGSVSCDALKRLMRAEASYNFARAYHHLGLLHLALPLYHSCLEDMELLCGFHVPLSWICPCFLCEQDLRLSDDAQARCTLDHGVAERDYLDELSRSCAHNLRLLYLSQQSHGMAALVGAKYLRWD